MGWTHTDQQIRANSHILTTLFPEQTKTLPRIIIWSIIFLTDLTIGIFAAIHFGWFQPENYSSMRDMTLPVAILVTAIVGVFWLQGVIWFGLMKRFQKWKANAPDSADNGEYL